MKILPFLFALALVFSGCVSSDLPPPVDYVPTSSVEPTPAVEGRSVSASVDAETSSDPLTLFSLRIHELGEGFGLTASLHGDIDPETVSSTLWLQYSDDLETWFYAALVWTADPQTRGWVGFAPGDFSRAKFFRLTDEPPNENP